MIKKSLFAVLFASILACVSPACGAEGMPKPGGWVNDYANVTSQEYRDKLTAVIEELRQKTSAEVFVVTIQSIAPYDEKSYARLIFDSWKPGKKGKDNGVVVLLAIKERRWRIETGYGVEGILPDGLCGEIGRNYMVPSFKAGDYGKGLYVGVAVIAATIAKDAGITLDTLTGINIRPASEYSREEKSPSEIFRWVFPLFIGSLIFPAILGFFLILFVCVTVFVSLSHVLAIVLFLVYVIVSAFRFGSWSKLPRDERGNFLTYGGSSGSGGSGWGGGFGGGGFGGGGGGCGGGGGGGGGF